MGKRMLRGWQRPKAGRGVGGGEGGQEGGGWGGGDREGESGRGQRRGGDGEGINRDGKRVAMGRGTLGGDGERGNGEGGNGEGGKGKEVGMGRRRRRGKRRGDFTDGYDGMPGWT